MKGPNPRSRIRFGNNSPGDTENVSLFARLCTHPAGAPVLTSII
jgi:hypothetical protein